MELSNDRVIELTWKYLRAELTEGDRRDLESWLEDPYNRERFENRITTESILEGITMLESAKKDLQQMEWNPENDGQLIRMIPLEKRSQVTKSKFYRIAAAAALVLAVGTVWLWNMSRKEKPNENTKQVASIRLPPGGNKAMLILADGSSLELTDAKKGEIAKQAGSDVVKDEDGEVTYRKSESRGEIGNNTISTPRGGQYRVVLPDGSKVWLDAKSSIQFPTVFTGKDRVVTLQGQGYFETVKDAAHPFIVTTGKMRIQVLGTSFDIMAYDDEEISKTSLVTGSIAVTGGDKRIVLKPEQESSIDRNGTINVGKFDPEQVLAWKNGFLEFDGADIRTVMRAVSRWWDLDVQYETATDTHAFTGQLDKNLDAGAALQILTTSGYHFKIDGRKITVLP